ncbi:MAG: hypothetical protein CR974_01445 [Gammaproteobacteria bacterium]|nr:MAG: hypothetical protein CR974_01445 [Gammaproteobacteria bacterium]
MKKFITLLLLCLTLNAFSQSEALKKIRERNRQANYIIVAFEQIKENKRMPKPMISNGQFRYAKGKGLIWEVLVPFPSRALLVDDAVYIEHDGQWQRDENDPMNHLAGEVLSELLSGDWQQLDEAFEERASEVSANGDWRVTLQTTNSWLAKSIDHIVLAGNANLEQVAVYGRKGNVSRLKFNGFLYQNTPLTAEQEREFDHH